MYAVYSRLENIKVHYFPLRNHSRWYQGLKVTVIAFLSAIFSRHFNRKIFALNYIRSPNETCRILSVDEQLHIHTSTSRFFLSAANTWDFFTASIGFTINVVQSSFKRNYVYSIKYEREPIIEKFPFFRNVRRLSAIVGITDLRKTRQS